MSPIEQLKKKLKDLSNQGSQSVNQISRSIPQPVKSFVKPIVQEVSNIATQQIPAAQRFTPLFQPTQNPIAFQNAAKQQIQNFQKNGLVKGAQNFGMDVFNSAKLGANVAGGSKILAGGVVNAAKTILPNAAIGGGINKLSGGSFSEGAGQGVALSPSLRGITAVTNPLIEKGVSRFVPRVNNQVANFVVPRITRGALNVPEGAVIDASLGRRPLSPESMALDFVSGSVLPGNPNAKLRVKGLKGVNPRAFKMHPEDIQTAKTVLDRLRGKMGTVQKEDKEYLMKTLNTLIDTYIPGYKNNKNQDVYKVLENLIYKNEGQGMDKLPIAMGLMAGQKATGYKDAPNKFSAIFDKKPRFEIDDSGAKVIPSSEAMSKLPYEERLKRLGSGQGVTLGEILDHKELYKQYPEIKNVKVIERGLEPFSKGTKASYDPATNTITLNDSLSPSEARKTLLHEIQHAIQAKEGFARGGSPESASDVLRPKLISLNNRIDEIEAKGRNQKVTREEILEHKRLTEERNNISKSINDDRFGTYQRLGGELESRSVANRADLTPEQRRTTLPYSDQGIKNQDVITRYDDGGVAGSIKVKPQAQIKKEVGGVSNEFYIRNGSNELVRAENAKPVDLGIGIDTFSHRFGKGTGVVISEAKTGMQIATGKNEKEAILNAQKAFSDLKGITPQELIDRQIKSMIPKSDIIEETDGGIGRRIVGDLNTDKEAIPHKEVNRFGSRRIMQGANPSAVKLSGSRMGAKPTSPQMEGMAARESLLGKSQVSRPSQARPELDQLRGGGALPLSGSKTQLVRVGESNPKLTGVPSSEMSPDLLSRKIIPQSPQKSFTQPGSATNTRADQIAPKFKKPADFEVEMDAQVGKQYEKPFTGKSKMKFKDPTTLPGDQATTDFATGRVAMGGNGIKGLPKDISDSFQQWVNTRRATQLEGVLKKKEFSDLNNKGIEGIFEFQSGNKTGRYGDVKKYFDTKYKTLQDNKIQFDFRQDYLPQLWANTPEEVSQVLGRRMGMKPSFTLDAVFKSYKEGIDAGLTPKFRNISDLTGWYEQKANKAIADKNFFDYLGKDGAIMPSTKAPMDWVTLDPDRFPKFLTQIGDEKFAGTYKAPKELADTINQYLKDPGFPLLEKVANYVSGVKSIALNFGIPGTAMNAHGINILARHTLMGSGGNPISRFLKGANFMLNQKASSAELDKVITRAPKAMKDGLMFSSDDYSNRIVEATGLKQKFGKKWEEVFGGPLFNKMLPALKISSYEELVKNGMDGKDAAKLVNNVYGGINWEQMGRSKDLQNLYRVAILAPDWAETTLRTGGNFAKAFNPKDRSMVMNRYRTMMATILGSYVAHNVVNKITSGHYSYENEPSNIFNIQIGYTEDGEKRYVRPYGTGLDMVRLPAEVAMGLFKGDFTGVTRLLRNRLSIPAGVFVGALTDQDYRGNAIGYRGTDKFGNPMSFEQRAGNIAAEGASLVGFPSFLKQAIASATGQQSLEAGLTQGFELPTRYQSPGNSKTQKYVGDVSELKGKDLYDIKSRFKGESPFSDNQKALINQGGINTLNEVMQLRDQKRQVNKSKDIEEKVVNGEMTEEEGQKALEEILKTSAPAAKAAPSGVSKADAAGLQFTSSYDGDVQQSNTSSDLGEEIAKNRVKISKKSERMEDKIIYPTEKGSATLDLSAPSKGNGIAAFSNKDWNITKAREVHNNDALSKEDKEYAFKKLGVEPEDARYDALASYTNDEKYQYLVSKSNTKEKLIENILTGRVRSIGDNIFASDGVIDTLVDEGKLTKEEGKKLKSIDYDKTGKLKVKTSKGKKLKIGSTPKLSAIEVKAPSKMQIIKFGGSSRKLQLKSRPVAQRPKLKLKIKKLTKPKLKVKSASKD